MLNRARFHARQVLYDLTSGLFFRPTVIIAVLAIVAIIATATMRNMHGMGWLFPGEPSAAQVVLGTIASSMMTVVSVVYSILLVALSLASMQFSTRILRHFVRDTVSQTTLGVFVGTFVYCLLVLRVVQSQPTPVVPEVGVGVAIVLALLAMAQLIYFIHHIVQIIQANYLVDQIAAETELVVDAVFTRDDAAHRAMPAGWDALPTHEVDSVESGYVQLVDEERLGSIAASHDAVICVRVPVGHFATTGLPIATVHAKEPPSLRLEASVRECFDVGPVRTMQDDVEWGLRQIVDIALKAVSPAVNDPSTAATCIDQLTRVLVRAARRGDPAPECGVDRDGRARVLHPSATLRTLIDLAFTQIRQYTRTDMAVSLRILRALEGVASVTRPGRDHGRILAHARLIRDEIEKHFHGDDCEELHARFRGVEAALERGRAERREP